MSSKARLCNACGRWAESGVWVVERDLYPAEDEEPLGPTGQGELWVHERPMCVQGAGILAPQPPPPEVDY